MQLTKAQILDADDRPTEEVPVPEWGGNIIVKTLTGEERDFFESRVLRSDKKVSLENIRAKLCAMCIIGEDGNNLFELSDVTALGKKSARALDKIFDVAQKLNGLGDDDIEEMAKNSASIASEDSTSN